MADPRRCSEDDCSEDSNRLLTVSELAAWLRLKPKGIYAMVEARRLPAIKVGSRLRFAVGEIKNWLRENRVSAFSESER